LRLAGLARAETLVGVQAGDTCRAAGEAALRLARRALTDALVGVQAPQALGAADVPTRGFARRTCGGVSTERLQDGHCDSPANGGAEHFEKVPPAGRATDRPRELVKVRHDVSSVLRQFVPFGFSFPA
jgi:hypothetical protein